MNDKPGWELQYQLDTLRADLAKAQAESEAAAKRWDEENASLAAQLAKAQARCAELEAVVREIQHNCDCGDGCANCERCEAALASGGTSALAAVRLAQRALTGEAGPLERSVALKALDEAFGSRE